MTLEELGFDARLEDHRSAAMAAGFLIGRVVAEHKDRYLVCTGPEELDAEITGNLRFSAREREDLPAVGDWVRLAPSGEAFALIHAILPRSSTISRQAVGRCGERQVVAANVDLALLVQAVDRDFSVNRLERYLAICRAAPVEPVVVLTKADLLDQAQLAARLDEVRSRLPDVRLLAVSSMTGQGCADLRELLGTGRTCCLLGSSGAGKSSLTNRLAGREAMRTGGLSGSTGKGRHVTSHRELVVLEGGGILVDNPGMREVGLTDGCAPAGSLDTLAELALECRFRDCTHTEEAGCAVLSALEDGRLPRETYSNWIRMEKEREHFESSLAQRRRKDRAFGKMLKNYGKGR